MRAGKGGSRARDRSGSSGGGLSRELAAVIAALAFTLALMMWGASGAAAGGPTSVLVTSPASGEATARYYSDKEYGELERLLGPANSGTPDKPPEAGLTRARQINVTWLAHDISPWRLDRIFPVDPVDPVDGSGPPTVWIHTAAGMPDSTNGYWHRAEHASQLRALLTDLGVMGEISGEGYQGIFPAPWQSETPAETTPPEETTTTTLQVGVAEGADNTDWWWALPGAAAGAVLALALRPLALRLPWDRLRRERRPRQELRDL
ncbi:hypothetical protein [Streptomyces sp. NPDC050287]|uniref:hypothetical protein n=1 Tax=Streptomyces sp. NPDC050287 TaxID=3365608 RepID=UPI0037988DF6